MCTYMHLSYCIYPVLALLTRKNPKPLLTELWHAVFLKDATKAKQLQFLTRPSF